MGYDRPMNLAEAAFPGRAETGGAGLDSFINGMHASHAGAVPAVDTVIGHSYGSTLVGGAATGGNHLAADNVIAVGSPGMLTEHASNLNLADGANVYTMTARNDIISWATDATLGADPFATDFGATRLTSNPGTSWDPTEFIGSVDAHSSYWDSQSNPALQNMGAIIAGLPPRADHHARRRGRTRIMTTRTSLKHRTLTALACLAAVSALSGCSDTAKLGPPTPTGATEIGGRNMSSPGQEPTQITPENQEQVEDTLLGYIKKTLQALPPGYVLDATRFGGTSSGIIGCDDNATGPDAPVRLTVTGDLKIPPGIDNVAVSEAFGQVWRSWGWRVYTDDKFRQPNQFGVSPDGYRLSTEQPAVAGFPPGFIASSPCFPGSLANDDYAFPVVITADN